MGTLSRINVYWLHWKKFLLLYLSRLMEMKVVCSYMPIFVIILVSIYIALKYHPPYLLIVVNLSEMFITEFCVQTSFLVNINDLMLIIITITMSWELTNSANWWNQGYILCSLIFQQLLKYFKWKRTYYFVSQSLPFWPAYILSFCKDKSELEERKRRTL